MKQEIVIEDADYLKSCGSFVNRNEREYLLALNRRRNNITLEGLQEQINKMKEELRQLKTIIEQKTL